MKTNHIFYSIANFKNKCVNKEMLSQFLVKITKLLLKNSIQFSVFGKCERKVEIDKKVDVPTDKVFRPQYTCIIAANYAFSILQFRKKLVQIILSIVVE